MIVKKQVLIFFFFIVVFLVGCEAIPTYSVPATQDINQVIVETAAVEMTRIANENILAGTEEPAADVFVEITPTPMPDPVQAASLEESSRGKDIALLLGTLSMEEGSWVYASEQFHVTWRIRNIGETTWDDTYSLVFGGGEAFGQDLSIPLSIQASPGDIIDLTLVLTAPEMTGLYRSEWWLVAPDGTPFGVGYKEQEPLIVEVNVEYNPVDLEDYQQLLFFTNYSTAEWRDQYGPAFCSATGNIDTHGFITRKHNVVFEGIIEENDPTLVMQPAQGEGGFIEGIFPPYHVTENNYFTTRVGCLDDNQLCDVTFKIFIKVIGEEGTELYWENAKRFDGEWIKVHKPLLQYEGQDIIFIFRVENNGNSKGDVVGWFAPMILN